MIGHELIRNQMLQSIKNGRISHAHIILGEEGMGKSLVAFEFALRILGKEKALDYVDIQKWRVKDNKMSIGVDDIREIIQEVNKKPYEEDKKVIIIYEADKITEQGQNVLLKTIEEPPHGVYLILLFENIQDVKDTIISRCQVHKLQKLNNQAMKIYIDKSFPGFPEEKMKAIINFSDGVPGRAERFITDKELEELRGTTLNIIEAVAARNKFQGLDGQKFFSKDKDYWKEVLTWFLCYIRDMMVYKETGKDELLLNVDKVEKLKSISELFSYNRLSSIINIINESSALLLKNVNVAMVYDSMIFKMMEV